MIKVPATQPEDLNSDPQHQPTLVVSLLTFVWVSRGRGGGGGVEGVEADRFPDLPGQ